MVNEKLNWKKKCSILCLMKWIANADLDSIENKCIDDDSIKKFLLFYDIKHLNSMLPRVCVEIINEDVKMCWLHLSSIAEQMKGNRNLFSGCFLCFSLKFCAGNWRTADQNSSLCACPAFYRCVMKPFWMTTLVRAPGQYFAVLLFNLLNKVKSVSLWLTK